MSGVNGADHTPFKSGGAAAWGFPDAARPPHEMTKGETKNNDAAQTVGRMEIILHAGPLIHSLLAPIYFLPSAAPAEPYVFHSPDPALDALIAPGAQIEKVADGFGFLEGPVWVHSGGEAHSDLQRHSRQRD